MNMKRKLLGAAVLSAFGLAGTAGAVNLSETGTGQVLLYPYYTVQGGFNTYISVTNTTALAKAVKVRFREAKNSAEVLDFNLYLSPYDVWTGTIVPDGEGARLKTSDASCTVPVIPADGQPFVNYYYTGTAAGSDDFDDDAENDLTRTREGYVEIIEMGTIWRNSTNDLLGQDGSEGGTRGGFEWAVTHNSQGVPNDCAAVNASWETFTGDYSDAYFNTTAPQNGLSFRSGGLMGQGTLINVDMGTDYTYDPVALENWDANWLHAAPGDLSPALSDAYPTSEVFYSTGSTNVIVQSDWSGTLPSEGANAVSAVLMHTQVMNSFNIDPGVNAGTDWVVTFPTKSSYVNDTPAWLPFNENDPFDNGNTVNGDTNGACQTANLFLRNREEQGGTGGVSFSPRPTGSTFSLCWEANVLTFGAGSNVLASEEVKTVLDQSFQTGWLSINFLRPSNVATATQNVMVSADDDTYYGLPVIGFAVTEFVNETTFEPGVVQNYGGNWIHKYAREIVTP